MALVTTINEPVKKDPEGIKKAKIKAKKGKKRVDNNHLISYIYRMKGKKCKKQKQIL